MVGEIEQAGAHVRARGLAAPDARLEVEPLTGGVSAEVVAVRGDGVDLVLKRALGQLKVEQEWHADNARIVTEARALSLVATLTPEAVPAVLDLDEERSILALGRAPEDWSNWRDELLAGRIDPGVGHRLGSLLGTWHTRLRTEEVRTAFPDLRAFVELRVEPFYRVPARLHPDLAGRIEAIAGALLRDETSLVHGDFTPKNVLAGRDGLWVLDWEVAHIGDPVFDPALMLAHLVLKAVHRRPDADRLHAVASAFLAAYDELAHRGGAGWDPVLVANLGCLLLARVDGKSPADYLGEADRTRVRALARGLLLDPPAHALDVWDRL